MLVSGGGGREKKNAAVLITDDDILPRVAFFLPRIVRFLRVGVLRPLGGTLLAINKQILDVGKTLKKAATSSIFRSGNTTASPKVCSNTGSSVCTQRCGWARWTSYKHPATSKVG